MKLSVFSVSMPEYTPDVAVKKLSALGYDGIEWRCLPVDPSKANEVPSFWGNNFCTIDENTILDRIDDISAMVKESGLQMPSLGSYLCCNAFDRIEKVAKAAALLGIPAMRVSPYDYDGSVNYRDLFAKAVEDYTVCEKIAKEYGVKMVMEMHNGNLTPSASAAYRLASHFDPKYIGVLYDIGNTVGEGYEQYQFAMELLGEYLAHVHVKNEKWVCKESAFLKTASWDLEGAPLWAGCANFDKFIAALKNVGYDGWLSVEDFTMTVSTDEKIANNIQYLRSIL